MSDNLFYHVIDQLNEITDQPIRLHMDGEPLLHKNFDEYARALNKRGHSIALASNGSLLKPSYADINMSILVNLSTSNQELSRRSKMNFDAYVKVLADYIVNWKSVSSNQKITYGIYTSRIDRNSKDIMSNKICFIDDFLRLVGMRRTETAYKNRNILFTHSNNGGGTFNIALFNIASGGLYPETETENFKSSLPKNIGFCDSPWKRFAILADGRAAYCCLDVTGSLAYTAPEEIWNTPLKTLFLEHESINAIRRDFLNAIVRHKTCRICLDRMMERTFRTGFQVSFDDFVKKCK